MTEEKNSKALKILTAVLTLGIIALGVYTMRFYVENQKALSRLGDEKAVLEDDLNDLILKYDKAIASNDIMATDLYEAKQRIERLLDSIENVENTNYSTISKFRVQIRRLEKEKDRLFFTVDSLSRQNERLATVVDSTKFALRKRNVYADSLAQENVLLTEKINKGSRLEVSQLQGEGLSLKSSGRLVNTSRHKRTDKIRACFNITKNTLAEEGNRLLLVQVINPKNNILGKKERKTFGDKTLVYSDKLTVFYDNKPLDLCSLIDASKADIVSGNYTINIFSDAELLSSTTFKLK